jgi:hypothetical protein
MAVVRIWSFMALQLDRSVSTQIYISTPVTYAVFFGQSGLSASVLIPAAGENKPRLVWFQGCFFQDLPFNGYSKL